MTFLAYAILFCVAGLFVYMARFSGRLRGTVVKEINAPLEEVYARVVDFRHWEHWSPWLEHDPESVISLSPQTSGVGSTYQWHGDRYGAMRFEHVRLIPNQGIEQQVRSLNPFRYRGRAEWTFRENNGVTELTWRFKGRVGFTLRPFAPTVQAAMVLDYRYALNKLARLLEPSSSARNGNNFTLDYVGIRPVAASRYAFKTYSGALSAIGAAMDAGYAELIKALGDRGIKPAGNPIAVYVKTNIKLRTTTCHMGIPVGEGDVADLPVRELPPHSAYVVRLTGSYTALEVAWYEAMQALRLAGHHPDQRIPPFECYMSPPGTPEGALVTELHIPVRQATSG